MLSPDTCAKCRLCCIFDRYELWETPVVSNGLKENFLNRNPGQKFIKHGESWLFKMETNQDGFYQCPALDPGKGCVLGADKPFDCKIWPYRVMNLGGSLAVTLSPLCSEMFNKPLGELCAALEKGGLGEKIFSEAQKNPDIIKEYRKGYPVLKIDN